MKIEVLFPEIANLYGDLSNIEYLKKCLDNDVEIIETSLNDEPAFANQQDINLIYMGPMTEKYQEIVIQKLKPYAEKIDDLVFEGKVFLMIGNAFEIFGKFIEDEYNNQITGLGAYHFYAHRNMMNRYSGYYLGKHEDIEVLGFKAQFTMIYGNNESCYFADTELGMGINDYTKYEGMRKKNFFGIDILGPFLILNPLFTKELLKLMGVENPKLAFEEDVMAAYNERLNKLKKIAQKEKN